MVTKETEVTRVNLRATETFHRRLKMAAAGAGVTMTAFIEQLLDLHEQRLERQRRAQVSPLHRAAVPDD